MIGGKTVLAVIPARGGSKGVPGKNIRDAAGKPLIAWSIDAAKKSAYIDRLILSSDDKAIIAIAKRFNCEVPFVRPTELAQDDTPGIDVVLHAQEAIQEKYDYVVMLQPTSPLRTTNDIDHCIAKCVQQQASACVTVTIPDKSPYWMYKLDENEQLLAALQDGWDRSCRQQLPPVYVLNGAVYVAKREWLINTRTFITTETVACIMPKERSIDIDTELDWLIFQYYLGKD